MHIGMISPIAWSTPPRHYGPWELIVSLLTEEFCKAGVDITLFATADSVTNAKLRSVCSTGYEEDRNIIPKVVECLHISEVFENADQFDLIHNHFDFLPLSYSNLVATPLVSTIHGFSSPNILPVYKKYNKSSYYISISKADRDPSLDYYATIHHGIDLDSFTFNPSPDDYLLFFGRIHPDKGAFEAIQIAKKCKKKLIMAGIIQDKIYYEEMVKPYINDDDICFLGSADPVKRDRLLGNASALLHPINFEEPFGLSVVESFACGTPVIAFNKGSMSEIIIDQKNGFLVTTLEEAISAVDNIAIIDRQFCRKDAVQRFSAHRMAHEYMHVYKKILDDFK